jgi:cathepsin X
MKGLAVLAFVSAPQLIDARHHGCCRSKHSESVHPHILSPLPYTYTPLASLPTEFDWRNIDGVNFVTTNLNQHYPQYCGSCWLHGAMSSLNDRLKIAKKAQFPEINLARQVVLNCGNSTAGSCSGGSDYGVYVFGHKFGIPDDTCQLYSAEEHGCSAFRNCMNCDPPTPDAPHGVCYPVQSYDRYFVREYGRMKKPSVHEMKAEIFRRGPISCSVDASFVEKGHYKPGDIVRVKDQEWDLDHDISIAGWGFDEESGDSFWIVRNSWGSFMHSDGWFKVLMGVNSMGIESECNWAVIDPVPVRKNWGPSDVNMEFASAVDAPRLGTEEMMMDLFKFEKPFTDNS